MRALEAAPEARIRCHLARLDLGLWGARHTRDSAPAFLHTDTRALAGVPTFQSLGSKAGMCRSDLSLPSAVARLSRLILRFNRPFSTPRAGNAPQRRSPAEIAPYLSRELAPLPGSRQAVHFLFRRRSFEVRKPWRLGSALNRVPSWAYPAQGAPGRP